jgi:hypothetical protein
MPTDREIMAARALIEATTDAELERRGHSISPTDDEIASANRWAKRQYMQTRRLAEMQLSTSRHWDEECGHVIA